MGNALVGRRSKQEQGVESIWFTIYTLLACLSYAKIFLSTMRNFIIVFLLLFAIACSNKKTESTTEEVVVNEMPALRLERMTGEKIRVDSLSGKTILVFFSPDCDHCQREADDIYQHLSAFREYSIYFIAARDNKEITDFASTYHLNDQPNVIFARADLPEVLNVMGSMGTPTLFIYSKEKRLVKKFENETPVEEIIKFL